MVGGGYIAVEMAGILNGLGSDCHFFFRGDTVLRRGFDPNVISELMKALEQHGPNLYPNHSPTEVNRDSDSGTLTVTFEHGKKDSKDLVTKSGFDCVLLAVGRRPKTGSLNLSAAGVQLGRKGYIEVDRFENTSTPGVYAIGDATTSGYELTPVSVRDHFASKTNLNDWPTRWLTFLSLRTFATCYQGGNSFRSTLSGPLVWWRTSRPT